MVTSVALLNAILAMDSYNRGYGAGIGDNLNLDANGIDTDGLGGPANQIGTATIILEDISTSARDAGFYAIAYEWNGQTIISYRGTDNLNPLDAANDIWNGWTLGAGFETASQAGLAISFYEAVVRDLDSDPNRTIFDAGGPKPLVVGHSMGGGLAGFVSLLSGSKAVGFDHMPFGAAAFVAIGDEVAKRVADKIQAGELPADFTYEITPALLQSLGMNVPDYANFSSTIVDGETNSGLRDGSIAMALGGLLGAMTGSLLGPLITMFGGHVSNGQTSAEVNIVPTQLVDMFLGGGGADTVTGNFSGRAIIATGGGNDTVYAKGGRDLIMLGAGDDIAYGAKGATVDGGFDRDTPSFANSVSSFGVQVFVSGASGTAMFGSSQWPSSTGTSEADYFRRIEHVVASTYNDVFVVQSFAGGDTPAISLDGGAGQDTIYFQETTRGVSLDLSKTTQSGSIEGGGIGQPIPLHIAGIEGVVSGIGSDAVIGNSSANILQLGLLDGARTEAGNAADGGGGDDIIRGGAGADVFRGGAGKDQVYGYYGDDLLEGGTEDDQIYGGAGKDELYGDGGNDFVWGGVDDDHLVGGAGNDRLYGEAGNDILEGGDGNDNIEGGDGSDALSGGAGDDIIRGGFGNAGSGSDIMDGGAGADQLYGSGGNDRLIGGAGNDYLNGGLGNNVFVFKPGFGRDTVSGFGTNPGDGDIIEIASSLFSSFAAVKAALTPSGSGTILTVDASNSIYFEDELSYYDNTGLLHSPFVESDFAFV